MSSSRSLMPREHGAYGELGVPLVTALLVAWPATPAAWLLGLASVTGFLAWEPLLVWLGRRGARARRDDGERARRRCFRLMAACGVSGGAALALAPLEAWWTILVPGVPAAVMASLVAAGRVTGRPAELGGAIALPAASVPIGAFAGASPEVVTTLGVVWVVGFVSMTLAVQVVLERPRRNSLGFVGGAVLLVAVGWATVLVAARTGFLPGLAPLSLGPMSLASVAIIIANPRPQRLKILGWAAVVASLASAALLVGGF